MSDKTLARRTAVKLYFKGADISKDLSKYLLSLSFTDKEEDETDDISISLDDREGKWIKDWLNTNKTAGKTQTVTKRGGKGWQYCTIQRRTGLYILLSSRTHGNEGRKQM